MEAKEILSRALRYMGDHKEIEAIMLETPSPAVGLRINGLPIGRIYRLDGGWRTYDSRDVYIGTFPSLRKAVLSLLP